MNIFYTLVQSFFKINFNSFSSSKFRSRLRFSKPYLFFSFLRTVIIILNLILDNILNLKQKLLQFLPCDISITTRCYIRSTLQLSLILFIYFCWI